MRNKLSDKNLITPTVDVSSMVLWEQLTFNQFIFHTVYSLVKDVDINTYF